MTFLKWESLLEKHIEGFFNKKFASDLQLVEIEKYLEREMQLQKKRQAQQYYIPNQYSLYMGAEDYQRLCPLSVVEQLESVAMRLNIRLDCLIEDKLQILVKKDASLQKGSCRIVSSWENATVAVDDAAAIESRTIVLERPTFAKSLRLPEHKVAVLMVVSGSDREARLELGEKKVHIGRREKNEFLLTDINASRLHACIAFEQYRHILYDGSSLNGTFVNGEKVDCHCLRDGDEIQIGNTILRYEVM